MQCPLKKIKSKISGNMWRKKNSIDVERIQDLKFSNMADYTLKISSARLAGNAEKNYTNLKTMHS